MKQELILKYQAYLDGELTEREARAIAAAIAANSEAQALVAELRQTRTMLAGNEPQATLPETREFYWSKIQRQIERLDREPVAAPAGNLLGAWRRFVAPLAGIAVMVFLAIGIVRFQNQDTGLEDLSQHLAEVENLSEHSTSFSFRSDNMFVVWVQDTDSQSSDDDVEFIDN